MPEFQITYGKDKVIAMLNKVSMKAYGGMEAQLHQYSPQH
jgi:hypothetical protein